MIAITITLDELLAVRDKLNTELAAWHAKNLREIANCVATKTSMHEHYWQPRYKLEQKLRAVNDLIHAVA